MLLKYSVRPCEQRSTVITAHILAHENKMLLLVLMPLIIFQRMRLAGYSAHEKIMTMVWQ